MKVLLIHNRYRQPGGEDMAVAAHQRLLEAKGHDVRVLQACNAEIRGHGAHLRTALNTLYSPKAKRRTTAEIAGFRPDIAHVHNTFPLLSPAVIQACKQAAVPVVQTLHNYRVLCPGANLFRAGRVCEACLNRFFPWRAVLYRCYRESRAGSAVAAALIARNRATGTYTKRTDVLIALTEFARQKFIAGGLPEHAIVLIPNWLDRDPGAGEGQGGFFLYAGRLSPEKGVRTLLDAWKKLKGAARLKIVGAGPLEAEVLQYAGTTAGMEYLGYKPLTEVQSLMQAATALLMPSQCYEGLPRAGIEAFAAGTPVIASRLGSLEAFVQHQRTGLLFAPGDSRDLATQVEWMMANVPRATEMRRAARTEFQEKYTADRAYELLLAAYRRALSARPN